MFPHPCRKLNHWTLLGTSLGKAYFLAGGKKLLSQPVVLREKSQAAIYTSLDFEKVKIAKNLFSLHFIAPLKYPAGEGG